MDWLGNIFSSIWNALGKAVNLLRHSKFADIWHALQRALSRFHHALQWYNEHVIRPFEKMRQNLIALYNHYFGPIIRLLDLVRSSVRILAIFDRKLAAMIDEAIWNLESAIYAPLYNSLRRLNTVTSTLRAIITSLGLLDRSLLVQSIERDWKSIWRVLLNNGTLPKPAVAGTLTPGLIKMDADFKQFVDSATGPFADTNTALQQVWDDTLQQVG